MSLTRRRVQRAPANALSALPDDVLGVIFHELLRQRGVTRFVGPVAPAAKLARTVAAVCATWRRVLRASKLGADWTGLGLSVATDSEVSTLCYTKMALEDETLSWVACRTPDGDPAAAVHCVGALHGGVPQRALRWTSALRAVGPPPCVAGLYSAQIDADEVVLAFEHGTTCGTPASATHTHTHKLPALLPHTHRHTRRLPRA